MSATDAQELERLVAALRSHHAAHGQVTRDSNVEPTAPVLQAACRVLLHAGIAPEASSWPHDEASALHDALSDPRAASSLEAQAARLWLTICLDQVTVVTADAIEKTMAPTLFAPFRGLGFRSLAFLGRRRGIAALAGSATSLDDCDAWVDMALPVDWAIQWPDRLTDGGASTAEALESWRTLLDAETTLDGPDPTATRQTLRQLALAPDSDATPYAQAVRRRVAARAAAALVRANVASGVKERVAVPATLPLWEREYLEGLEAWQRGDVAFASARLRAAVAANPWQGGVRLALATLRAPASPEEALVELDQAEPTRQVLTSKAALLARLRRYGDAEGALHAAATAPDEPIRFAGARWKRRCRRQELRLHAAFAERRGDWQSAARCHVEAAGLHQPPDSRQPRWLADAREHHRLRARRLLLEARRARSFRGPLWLKTQYTALVDQGDQDLASVPLTGDAQLFRALAIVDRSPDRAAAQLTRLLDERDWMARQAAVGGDRILVVADALFELGKAADALRACESMAQPWGPAVEERRAVALTYLELVRQKPAADLSRAVRAVARNAPRTYWPHVFAALAHALAAGRQAAEEHLARARELGSDDATAAYLRSVLTVREGRSLDDESLAEVELSERAWELLAAFCPGAAGRDAHKVFLRSLGPELIAQFVVQPERAAQRLLIEWGRTGRVAEAWPIAERLAKPSGPLSREVAAWLAALAALDEACRRNWQSAEAHLARADAHAS